MGLPQSVWRYIDSTNTETSFCSPIWQVKHVFLSPAFQTEGSFLEWSGGHVVATQGRYSLPTPTRCMGPSKKQPPLTSWVSWLKSLQMLFKLTLLIVFLKNGNLPNPQTQLLTPDYLQPSKPSSHTLQTIYQYFICLSKLNFIRCCEKESKRNRDKSCLEYSQFCCSFPQNVRLHMPCFNFGFNIYFSYRILFKFIWGF